MANEDQVTTTVANDSLEVDPRLATTTASPASPKPAAPVPPRPAVPLASALKPTTAPVRPAATSPAARSAVPKVPASLKMGFTGDLKETAFLHALIYADTGMRKTSIACTFDDPTHTLIVATRRPEQLTPVRDMNYAYIEVTDSDALEHALLYPEALWAALQAQNPALKELRTLVLDDATEAVDLLLEGARDDLESGGHEMKDRRRMYARGKDDLREMIKPVFRKPLNFIATAVAKVRENPITNEETVGPDLPPSMLALIGTEFEFVLYIQPSSFKFTTDRDFFTFTALDDKGKEKTFKRSILAKSKLPLELAKRVPPVIAKTEDPDLRKLWDKVVQASKTVTTSGAVARTAAPQPARTVPPATTATKR